MISWVPLPPSIVEQALLEQRRQWLEDVSRAFALPSWLLSGDVPPPSQAERDRWRRRLEKDARRRRYYRRYNRGKR